MDFIQRISTTTSQTTTGNVTAMTMTMTIGLSNIADTQAGKTTQFECVDCMDDDFETLVECSRVMKWEKNRRETFKTWPTWGCQRPECLAKAGFYYTKISDRVQCPFCFGVLKKWESWDEPMSEHRRHFPHCKFIQGEDVGNVPIEDNSGLLQRQITPVCVNEPTGDTDFKKEVNRLASFSRWPPNTSQTPEVLARAGFYHVPCGEKPDRVRCAYCQGKLYNWKPEDDPWIEHAKCFPSCPYIKLCMGEDTFVDILHERDVGEKYNAESEKDQLSSAKENNSTPQTNIRKLMHSEAVQAVLQMGFSKQLVIEVLKNQSKSGKGKCFSAQELASEILNLEKALETTKTISQTTVSTERTQSNTTQGSKTDSRKKCDLQNYSTSNTTRQGNSDVLENMRGENFGIKDRYLCKICMESPVRVTFTPCGHLACCGPCSMAVSSCPICRTTIQGCVRTYF